MQLKCNQCLLPLDLSRRTPRCSPRCGHTYCSRCIERKLRDNYNVFVCKVDQEVVKASGLQEFPKNLSLIQILSQNEQHKDTGEGLDRAKSRLAALVGQLQRELAEEVEVKVRRQLEFVQEKKKYQLQSLGQYFYQVFQAAKGRLEKERTVKKQPLPQFEAVLADAVRRSADELRVKLKPHCFVEFNDLKIQRPKFHTRKTSFEPDSLSESRGNSGGRAKVSSRHQTLRKSHAGDNESVSRPETAGGTKHSYSSRSKMQKVRRLVEGSQNGVLELIGAGLRDEDLRQTFELIEKSGKEIYTLKLVKNEITDVGFRTIRNKLMQDGRIHTLNLTSNHLTEGCLELLEELLQHNRTLKNLYLNNNSISKHHCKVRKAQLQRRGLNLYL